MFGIQLDVICKGRHRYWDVDFVVNPFRGIDWAISNEQILWSTHRAALSRWAIVQLYQTHLYEEAFYYNPGRYMSVDGK